MGEQGVACSGRVSVDFEDNVSGPLALGLSMVTAALLAARWGKGGVGKGSVEVRCGMQFAAWCRLRCAEGALHRGEGLLLHCDAALTAFGLDCVGVAYPCDIDERWHPAPCTAADLVVWTDQLHCLQYLQQPRGLQSQQLTQTDRPA